MALSHGEAAVVSRRTSTPQTSLRNNVSDTIIMNEAIDATDEQGSNGSEDKLRWVDVRTCLISGVGFFADAYDTFVINLAVQMIGFIYFADNKNMVPHNIDMALKVSAAVGTFFGQIVFGFLADSIGRKRIYGLELVLIVFCTIASTFSGDMRRGLPMWATLVIWRLLLGIGIGGEYPLSATITSEFSQTKQRGAMIAAVFAMQGFGILAASVVAAIVLVSFRSSIEQDIQMMDYVWRLCIGIGVIPGFISIYYRISMPESPRYQREHPVNRSSTHIAEEVLPSSNSQHSDRRVSFAENRAEDESKPDRPSSESLRSRRLTRSTSLKFPHGEKPKTHWGEFWNFFKKWHRLKILLGTSIAWFSLDVAFYGVNLNNATILTAIGFASEGSPYDQVMRTAVGNIIISGLGALPGYWVTVFTVERMGRKRIQLMGFAILTVIYVILGAAYNAILNASVALFVVLFSLGQFFQNWGPNATTFILPGEVFPTRVRSTAHGISAASGKLGAIVAQVGFSQMKDIGGPGAFVGYLLIIFAVFMAIGFVATFWIPETAGKSLEEIEAEIDQGEHRGNPPVPPPAS